MQNVEKRDQNHRGYLGFIKEWNRRKEGRKEGRNMNKISQSPTAMEHENEESTKWKQFKQEQKIKVHKRNVFFCHE
jgi:hypothetical protein